MSDTNPVTDYFQEKQAAKDQRKQNELDLWRQWKNNGEKPEHLEPLLKLYDPVMGNKMRQSRAPNIPASAFKIALQEHFINALKTYNPEKSALNTHVENHLRKVHRYNIKHQNFAYIAEDAVSKISPILKAQGTLEEELGREPTHQEIADHITESTGNRITAQRVATVIKSQRKDIPGSSFESDPVPKPSNFEESQIAVAANILPHLFPNKPQIHTLFNHMFATNDHEKITSTTALAKKLGTNLSQVSRMKKIIGDELRKQMGIKLPGEEE